MENRETTNFIKVNSTFKSQKYACMKCNKIFYSIKYYKAYDGTKINVCDYKYCPYCGRENAIFSDIRRYKNNEN